MFSAKGGKLSLVSEKEVKGAAYNVNAFQVGHCRFTFMSALHTSWHIKLDLTPAMQGHPQAFKIVPLDTSQLCNEYDRVTMHDPFFWMPWDGREGTMTAGFAKQPAELDVVAHGCRAS